MVKSMNARTSVLVIALLIVSSILTVLPCVAPNPTLTVTAPKEGDRFNVSTVHLSGMAAGSSDTLLVTTEANFQPGIALSQDITVTDTGEVALFFLSEWQKLNGGAPVLTNGSASKFDGVWTSGPMVLNVSGTYHMWYMGADANFVRIGHATSLDGVTWTRTNGGNQVIDKGAVSDIDSFQVRDPFVIYEGGNYYMWFVVNDGLTSRISFANSTDGDNWTKHGSAVLDITGTGHFDRYQVDSPSVLKIGSIYHMWYSGTDETDTEIGYATSPDGKTWTRKNSGNPVLSPSNSGFDLKLVLHPEVTFDGNAYTMYYVGFDGTYNKIGRACSPDGITWERTGTTPVLSLGTGLAFDTKRAIYPSIVRIGDKERMWYAGENTTTMGIGMAEGTVSDLMGEYLSPAFEFGGPVTFGVVSWNTTVPAGTTIDLKVRTSTDKGTWTDWVVPTKGSALQMAPNSYLQFKVNMTSDDRSKTPLFQDFTLDYFKPVVKVEISKDGLNWYPANGNGTWSADIEFADGNYTVHVRSTDSAGGKSQITKVNITVDANAPSQGTVKINGMDMFTNKRAVTLTLNATDFSPLKEVIISEDLMFNTSVTKAFAPTLDYTLTGAEGLKEVFVRFTDIFGHTSVPFNDSIVLDMTAPRGNVTISGGADFTSVKNVPLTFAAEDDNTVVNLAFSDDPLLTGATWIPFTTTTSYDLKGKDGEKTIYVGYKDSAGNMAIYSDKIVLDMSKPAGTIMIDEGEPVTISLDVNITVDGTDNYGVEFMKFSNTDDMTKAEWMPYAKFVKWHLAGAGDKADLFTVYAAFKDGAGLDSSVFKDTIGYEPMDLDSTVIINGGNIYSNSNVVDVLIKTNNTELVSYMMVSDQGNFTDAEWVPFTENVSVTIATGDGRGDVFVKFMDSFGMETIVYSDVIILDLMLPEVYVRTPAKSATIPAGEQPVSGDALDNMGVAKVEVCISTTPNCTGEEAWVLATGNTTWSVNVTFEEGGTWYVLARAWDIAGNTKIDAIPITVEMKKKKKSPGPVAIDVMASLAIAGLVMALIAGRRRRG